MKIKLTKVDSSRGSPMGRPPTPPSTTLTIPIKLRIHRIRLNNGGYDSGGAYWGGPDDLWRAIGEDGDGNEVVEYVRADSRLDAARAALDQLHLSLDHVKFWGLKPDAIPAEPKPEPKRVQFKLHPPLEITIRLLPGVRIGQDSWISIEYAGWSVDKRTVYRYYIDMPKHWHKGEADLKSGVGGGNLQEGLVSLLSFLSAEAEHYRHHQKADMFMPPVAEWAYQNSVAIDMLRLDLEQPGLIEENSET